MQLAKHIFMLFIFEIEFILVFILDSILVIEIEFCIFFSFNTVTFSTGVIFSCLDGVY